MTNATFNAPSAYSQYAEGAPAPQAQSFSTSAAPQSATPGAYPPGAVGAANSQSSTPDQGQAWQLLSQAAHAMATASQAPAPAVAPAATPVAPAPVAPASVSPFGPGGGIRMTGPWIAGEIYGVVPTGPITAVPDNSEKWFAITKGRYVGVTNSAAIADGAVSRVSHSLRAGYTTQTEALEAFNSVLALNIGLVAVIH
ncbi:hypothetical protein B0H11DRAFT_2253031 [Mycena galericulata]|nr:hypothetical protein B0H11DRAFT_2253031 [Mycena galericulata]